MLANELNLPFFDTDLLIEEWEGMSIQDIFETLGEEEFRSRESSVIKNLPKSPSIISTGGGAVMRYENVADLRRDSLVLFLDVSPNMAYKRIQGSDRPALTGNGPEEEVKSLISKRHPFYRRSSDYCIDANGEKESVFRKILGILGHDKEPDPSPAPDVIRFFEGLNMPDDAKKGTLDHISQTDNVPPCAIAGNPCLHSKSPQIYMEMFEKYGIDSYYTFMEWDDIGKILEMVKKAGMKGLSVTIPFKEEIIPHLNVISNHARMIGAVNTVLNSCGNLYGTNTDWIGIREPLKECGAERGVIFGAGGAARAAAYAMLDLGMDVTILNRTLEKAEIISRDFGCSFGGLEDYDPGSTDAVVNATPLGMEKVGGTILSAENHRKGMVVFDLVYTPPLTNLLSEAGKAGCRCIQGTEMFIHQAAAQFYELFGIAVSPDEIREVM